jgi:predicted extracellular nuclease
LDFSSPVTTGTLGALDGNNSANRTAISFTINGLSISNGSTFWIRWNDLNASGADDGLAVDDFSITPTGTIPVEDSAPSISDIVPTNGAIDVVRNSNIVVTFSEPVNVIDNWYTLSCATSGSHTAVVSGGPMTFTLDPGVDFDYSEVCTLSITAANITDQDSNDPPDNMVENFVSTFTTAPDFCALPYTPIPQIQGSGASVALTGTQTTQGVVVGDYEGASPALRGFFIQDPAGDSNLATSDGIFVFESSNLDTVSLGDVVRVTGTAGESNGQSQISAGTITKCGSGTVTPTDVTFPVASADFLEQYEGMLVRLPQTLYVTEHFQLGRFDQVVLSANARLQQPTNVVAPGAPALALQAQNNLDKIILDDASQAQNPDPILFARGGQPLSASNTLRGGDTATGIVGVLNYTWAGNSASGNAYRVRPINALNGYVNFEPTNPRPTSVPAVGGALKVVGMNLLNFFNTFTNCTNGVGGVPATSNCRGAANQTEFDRQWPKTVAAITALNPDVVGVNELENDGYGPDSAIQFLVDKLNEATAPGTYAFINVDAIAGQENAMGTDGIKVAMLYKPAVVTPVGKTAPLNTVAFVNGGDAAPRSRPALIQAFEQNGTGARFIFVANHLKSKGSACDAPDAGDGQGNCNVVRTNAATELVNFLATDPTGTGDPDILLAGDYNSYAMENPITVIKNAGFTNLIEKFQGQDAYSYVFDGQWGYLDHSLASASLVSQVSGVADYHINSDEPSVLDYNTDFKSAGQIVSLYAPDQFRISDHDPVVVGLNLNAPPSVSAGGPYAVIQGKSVTLTATGTDPNGDALTYAWDLDNDGTFETPGQSVVFDASAMTAFTTKTVKVQVTDNGGLTGMAEATININFGFFFPLIFQ